MNVMMMMKRLMIDDEGTSAWIKPGFKYMPNSSHFTYLYPKVKQKAEDTIQLFPPLMDGRSTDTEMLIVDSRSRSNPESEQSEQSSDNIPMQDEGHASTLNQIGHPPNDFPEPENNWANTYATTYQVPTENKLQRKTYDIGSFIKWFCRQTGKKKICKADLEGPAFNLVKAFHKNIVFLQYQMDECHKLLTNKFLEWEADVDSEHFDRDDNTGDDNEETKPDPEEIYNSGPAPSLMTLGYISSGLVQILYYNLPSQTVSPDPVSIVASRAIDPVGSPSSTYHDQGEQYTSTYQQSGGKFK
ncbi:hypothetical protein Tco_0897639 [Tanacetum coccineum]